MTTEVLEKTKQEAGGLTRYTVDAATLLLIYNVFLKLIGAITWSWWIVVCPIWVPIAIAIGVLFIILLVAVFVLLCLGILFISLEIASYVKERKSKNQS